MQKISTDWNKVRSDGTLLVTIPYGEKVPKIGTAVLATDSGERVAALVVRHNRYTHWGVEITIEPNWDSQEEDT